MNNRSKNIGCGLLTIVIIYGNKAKEKIRGKHLLIVPDVSNPTEVSWQCSSPDIPDKWLIKQCRS